MNVSFSLLEKLPDVFEPGKIYFIKEEGAIYVALSETEVEQYSHFQNIEDLSNSQQKIVEDLEIIRTNAEAGAEMAKTISVISNDDINTLFENI